MNAADARKVLVRTLVKEFAEVPTDEGQQYDDLAALVQSLEAHYPGLTDELNDALDEAADVFAARWANTAPTAG